jgi:hypothetical protein
MDEMTLTLPPWESPTLLHMLVLPYGWQTNAAFIFQVRRGLRALDRVMRPRVTVWTHPVTGVLMAQLPQPYDDVVLVDSECLTYERSMRLNEALTELLLPHALLNTETRTPHAS